MDDATKNKKIKTNFIRQLTLFTIKTCFLFSVDPILQQHKFGGKKKHKSLKNYCLKNNKRPNKKKDEN